MLKMLFKFRGFEWSVLCLGIGLIILGTYLDLEMPQYLAEMITEVQKGAEANQAEIWRQGSIMITFALGSAMTVILCNYIFAVLSAKLSNRLREQIFDKVNSFGESEVKKFSVAGLLTRMAGDTAQVCNFFATAIQFLIKAPLMAFGAAFIILEKSGQLSVITFVATGALLLLVMFLIVVALPKFKSIQTRTDELNLSSRENLNGLRVVRAYNAEKLQENKFNMVNRKLAKTFFSVNISIGILFPFINLLMCAVGLANWWVGSTIMERMPSNEASVFFSNLAVFSQYSVQMIVSFMFLLFVMVQMPRAMVSAKRINEVLSVLPAINDGRGGVRNLSADFAIEFNGVNFCYPGGGFVLKDINFEVKAGERIAFIGSTGCGKTTLVNLIPRLYDATEGEIKLFGANIKDYALNEIHKMVAYIPQKAMLFKGTIRDNVACGFGEQASVMDEEIWQALETAQGKDFVEKLDGKLDFMVAQHGDNLSGGQKQRIAIARGVVRKPNIYIFDDTSSALDYATDAKLRSALNSAVGGAVQIVVAQRIGTVKNMDKIFVLENGVIVGAGRHKELMKSCSVYKEIALSQLSAEELK
jgi:ATP-binding cassette subfamily B protein